MATKRTFTSRSREKLARLAPPPGVQPSLVVQTFTYSVGTGFYAAGSAIFFTVYAGLPAGQIALGVTASAFAVFVLRIPVGLLCDRLGGRATWRLGALLQGVLFSIYPFVHGFASFLIVIIAAGIAATVGNAGKGRYIGEVIARQSRVRVNAYLRSIVNIGLALGTVSVGALTQVSSPRILVVIVLMNALTFYLDVLFLTIFIKPAPRRTEAGKKTPGRRSALADRPFVALSALSGVFILSDLLLTTVIPLWILQATQIQQTMIPIILILNMAMVIVLQARVGKGVETISDSARRQRRAGILLAVSCALIPISSHTAGVWTWMVILGAVAIITQAEMYTAVSGWGLSYGLSPQERLGEYLGVFASGSQIALIVGPAVLIPLVTATPLGWYVLSALFLVAGLTSVHLVDVVVRSRSKFGVQPE
ncbi:MFS transporter [Actinophytocola xinjiangensis]|uniref:MFS transporter n=1 Tax=Actinophytocola xinjiangensis TaxID=485602 RepID=UPI000B2FF481|nr:MFS transporter [Actinophytocola xinjiangensis]